MQFEAKKPTHGRLAARRQTFKNLVIIDTFIVTDFEWGGIGKIKASFLAGKAVK